MPGSSLTVSLVDPNNQVVESRSVTTNGFGSASGEFGVPTIQVDERVFWGVDALPMVAACLRGDDPFFAPGGPWDAEGVAPPGVVRQG